MAAERTLPDEVGAGLQLDKLLDTDDIGACCATLYEHPAVRWLLGDELHPGGATTTRRAFELMALGREDRLLDVACGSGASALLAVRERGCEAVGVDRSEGALAHAREDAQTDGIAARAGFQAADAGALPFADASFSALLCECSLSTFADKAGAVAEMRRVLSAGGRIAVSDVVVDADLLPEELRGPPATVACVGDALDTHGYEEVLRGSGFELTAIESHDEAAARLVARVEDRLRGARLLGFPGTEAFIEAARLARWAIEDGILGYSTYAAVRG
jgi:arsenite methyltransferase